MTRVLCVVAALALVFTTVNVTRFATSRDVPLGIAVLLDPMIGTALAGVLYVDARLAAWAIPPPAWSTALRWAAGSTAALMNTWESLWPDRRIGWPRHADPAAVLLHLTPALLLVGLTETIAAYRRTLTHLTNPPTTGEPPHPLDQPPADTPTNPAPAGIPITASPPTDQPPAPPITPDDLWDAAVQLDETARKTTGTPVTVWRLRQELRIGPRRAARLHERLRTHRPTTTHPTPTTPTDHSPPSATPPQPAPSTSLFNDNDPRTTDSA
jgi:hypothetical protein